MESDDFPATHPQTADEIEEALRFESARSPVRADRLRDRIKAAVARVHLFPEAGSVGPYNTRRIVLTPFPYQLIYQVRDPGVFLVALAHTSRQTAYWADRLN